MAIFSHLAVDFFGPDLLKMVAESGSMLFFSIRDWRAFAYSVFVFQEPSRIPS